MPLSARSAKNSPSLSTNSPLSTFQPASVLRDETTGKIRSLAAIEDGMVFLRANEKELSEGLAAPRFAFTVKESPAPGLRGAWKKATGWVKRRFGRDNRLSTLKNVTDKSANLATKVAPAAAKLGNLAGPSTRILASAAVAKDIVKEVTTNQPVWKKVAKSSALLTGAYSLYFLHGLLGFSVLLASVVAPYVIDYIHTQTSKD